VGLFTERDELDDITRTLQLHEEVQVTYLVDHYRAVMITRDGACLAVIGQGPGVFDALRDLNEKLSHLTLKQLRALEGELNPDY
jgi:hypothetical protein